VETGFVDVLGRENVFPTVRAGVSAFVAGERPSSELLRGVFAATITEHVVEGSA
jgi:hypothetical protein